MEITELPIKIQKEVANPPTIEKPNLVISRIETTNKIKLPKHWVPNVSPNQIDVKYQPREPTKEERDYFYSKYSHRYGTVINVDYIPNNEMVYNKFKIKLTRDPVGIKTRDKDEFWYVWHFEDGDR